MDQLNRRDFLKFSLAPLAAESLFAQRMRGLPDLKIEDVKVITTGVNDVHEWVILKIITDEPGLYGIGSATNVLYTHAIVAAIEKHLKPFWLGKGVNRIEDLWHATNFRGYWRNSTVHNNILAALDMALWDIKAKRAGMPLYELLGGKVRDGVAVYVHADGQNEYEAEQSVGMYIQKGFQYIRVQLGGYGGGGTISEGQGNRPEGGRKGPAFDEDLYVETIPHLFERLRSRFGYEVKFLHDVHERLTPTAAVVLAKRLEPYRLFFLEDPLPPEYMEWLENIRQACVTPIAMGELFTHPHEWTPLITRRLIDFIRCRVSQVGGVTPARKIANLCENFGVRTAWQQGGDNDPVNIIATWHLELTTPNFGIHEEHHYLNDLAFEIFPGMPIVKAGYLYGNDQPGLGVDMNEELAAKFPIRPKDNPNFWTSPTYALDGTIIRP